MLDEHRALTDVPWNTEEVMAFSPTGRNDNDRLHELVGAMAQVMSRIDIGDTWTGLTCAEFDSIFDVLVEAGHQRIAEQLMEQHATGDDEGDEHWALPPHVPVDTGFA